jgi:hypothetical protein
VEELALRVHVLNRVPVTMSIFGPTPTPRTPACMSVSEGLRRPPVTGETWTPPCVAVARLRPAVFALAGRFHPGSEDLAMDAVILMTGKSR